jgi:hypothetical protein
MSDGARCRDKYRKELVMPATLEVLGIEVVQSIQNLKQDIPLLAHKRTAVRVYVSPSGLTTNVPVVGTLVVTRDGGSAEVESASSVELRRDGDHPSLEDQRRSLARSLCFFLTDDQVRPGRVELSLKKVTPTLLGDIRAELLQHRPTAVEFQPGPTLRVRAVCLRVRDPQTNKVHAPNAGHCDALRSYLERAFPVSEVQSSAITIDAAATLKPPYSDAASSPAHPGPTWQEKFDIACAYLMAVRAREIDEGEDQRTHYYGVVHHPTDFFVGAVSDVPSASRPDVVGVGPVESGDGSYAAHELAHALGRLHPGYGPGQSREDPDFPEAYEGKLSSAVDGHHGFDVGDATQRPRVLPFDHWYDLMTYGEPLWVSAYTYQGLLERLRQEDQQFAKNPTKGNYLHVIGTYSFADADKKGNLAYVFPGKVKSPAAVGLQDRVAVIGKSENEAQLFRVNVELKRAAATDLPRDSGAFHITVNHDDRLRKLELWVDGELVDSIAQGSAPHVALAAVDPSRVKIILPAPSEEDPYLLAIAWPEQYSRDLLHTVQARRAGRNEPWRTIAAGVTAATAEVLLDHRQLALPSAVDVRILRAHGFSEAEIYRGQLRVADPGRSHQPVDHPRQGPDMCRAGAAAAANNLRPEIFDPCPRGLGISLRVGTIFEIPTVFARMARLGIRHLWSLP